MADVGASLTKGFDYVRGRFLGRLEGLGDAGHFWEPVPGCWPVRQSPGHWLLRSGRTGVSEMLPMTVPASSSALT